MSKPQVTGGMICLTHTVHCSHFHANQILKTGFKGMIV